MHMLGLSNVDHAIGHCRHLLECHVWHFTR